MSEFIALKKAENFAVRITNAHRFLVEVKNERRISDQLYRSGTSVMANLAEAQYAASEADYGSILRDINEIIVILIAIVKPRK